MMGDLVNNPDHYKPVALGSDITCLDTIEAMGYLEGYLVTSIIRYLWRYGRKDDYDYLTDLKKAQWCLNKLVDYLETGGKVNH